MVPLTMMAPLHSSYCEYGFAFSYVPGDSGNPFVAIGQATLLNAILLAGTALALLFAARQTHRAAPRYLGFGYVGASVWCGVLSLIIVFSSTPLYCEAPGEAPATAAQQRAFNTVLALNNLTALTIVLTVALVAVAIVALVAVATSSRRPARR